MKALNKNLTSIFLLILIWTVILSLIISCNPASNQSDQANQTAESLPNPQLSGLQVELIFLVHIPPENHNHETPYYLDVLDEVTGLSINPQRHLLEKIDDENYGISITKTKGLILKYRYIQGSNPSRIEHNSEGEQIEFRAYPVTGPDLIEDQVVSWTPLPYPDPVGRIQGTIKDTEQDPLVNVMISAAGQKTLTSADGSFLIENVPEGKHLISAFALDGEYQPFHQYAVIVDSYTTPAEITLSKSTMVNITFQVNAPEDNVPNTPMRIVGDLFKLGNIFTEIPNGSNIIPSRSPLLTYHPDGFYRITLSLPSGYSLHYKYTLGDGFWNAEHTRDHGFITRKITIPDEDTLIEDVIETWKSGDSNPVMFHVSVPQSTDINDTLSIQFKPFGWSSSIPMWPLGSNQWFYVLYSPMDILGEIGYRYCRNDQCGIADDLATSKEKDTKNHFVASTTPLEFNDVVTDWSWWQPKFEPTSVLAADINKRQVNFITGIEFFPGYDATWQSRLGYAFQNIQGIGAEWVFLTPTWTFTTSNPPQLEQVPGKDILWNDLVQASKLASQSRLNTAIFPITLSTNSANEEFWGTAKRDSGWWNSWFARYKTFLLYHAKFAAETGAGAIILGEPGIYPALPEGILPDGSPSGVPEDSADKWQSVINEIRQIYQGKLIWAVNYPGNLNTLPEFVSGVDILYVLFSAPLSEQGNQNTQEYAETISGILSQQVFQIKQKYNKPIIMGLSYMSTAESAQGCTSNLGFCEKYEHLSPFINKITTYKVDLTEQMEIYNGALLAINDLNWIDGVVSRGYFPPAPLHDPSPSIHGKPAADVLWYWFPELVK